MKGLTAHQLFHVNSVGSCTPAKLMLQNILRGHTKRTFRLNLFHSFHSFHIKRTYQENI
jgi:hypothetical protein